MARATAQKPHWITIALSIIAILLSAVSLYQSCAVQKLSRATARAMVIFGAAELTGFNVSQKVGEQMRTTSLTFNVQVQNVGKAMAHNVTLHYQAHLLRLRQAEISENGQILFGDDPRRNARTRSSNNTSSTFRCEPREPPGELGRHHEASG
jgi:hypothetical protein